MVVSGSLLLSLFLFITVFFLRTVASGDDEALFAAVGKDSITRFYYEDEGGEWIEALGGRFMEWEKERVHGSEKCIHTPIDEMPDYLKNAFVAIEDHRFYRHGGVDILRTAKAAFHKVFRTSSSFGGSTITQQLIKNMGGERERTVMRKLREMARAIALETRHSKEEILEAYLGIVPLANGCVGVGAASHFYFGKEPSELTLDEAAGLACITRAPARLDPYKHPEAYLQRRNVVLSRMAELGYITQKEKETAQAAPLILKSDSLPSHGVHSWYTETVMADVKAALIEQGYTEAAATALLYTGGLRIYTAMDKAAQEAVEDYFGTDERFASYGEKFSAATVVLSVKTGDLLAVYGGAGPKTGDLLLNRATDTLRPPGSALKPLALYAPAIEGGFATEASVFDDVPKSFGKTLWPRNSPDRYDGLIDLGNAVSTSKNTVAIELYRTLGVEHIYSFLTGRFGISTLVRSKTGKNGQKLTDLAEAPLALGQLTLGVSVRELAEGYVPLANGGIMPKGSSYFLVTDGEGEILLTQKREEKRAISSATASVMTHMLRAVVEKGSAEGLALAEIVDTAGKTGTSSLGRDRWFVGYTPYYLCAVFCGTDGEESVGGRPHLDAFDGIMLPLHEKREGLLMHFQKDPSLTEVRVCRDSGELLSEACALDPRGERGITVWVPAGKRPTQVCTCHTPVYYDKEGKGVVLSPTEEEKRHLRKVSLLFVPWRDFPCEVIVTDAEYVYRPLGDVGPARDGRAFFATLLPEGHYVGKSHDGRPFNALAEKKQVLRLPPKKREILPSPRIPEKRASEKKDPIGRLIDRIFRR